MARQLELGEGPVYHGKAFTCQHCGRRFRNAVRSKAGKGWATQWAEANRDRHEIACAQGGGRPGTPAEQAMADLRAGRGLRPLTAFPPAGGTGGPAGADAARHLPLTPRGRQPAAERP